MLLKELENNTYIKATYCGIVERKRTTKEGVYYRTDYDLVLENDRASQKQFVRLSKDHISNGLHNELNNSKLLGLTLLVPVFFSSPNIFNDKAYQTIFYGSDDMPIFIQPTK